ncbi:MAG: amino acid ABC transporter permease [Clostridiales bacterium]|nr:amino acid ABC transporter permease [Clostridiales bacterium]
MECRYIFLKKSTGTENYNRKDEIVNAWFSDLQTKFVTDFIEDDRYLYIVDGLKTTLIVTFMALIVGLILGALVAVVRTSYSQMREESKRGVGGFLLKIADAVCRVYLTVIRGTPALVQLLIMYFIILSSPDISKTMVAIVTFGINSGAYVAEIFRSGILSIDVGQMEAGRSLGLGYVDTMTQIIMPQAIKNCLPALINEIIALLKETSICGYIGLAELTRGGDIIRGVTFDPLLPLIVVAIVYLIIVMFFTWIMSLVERRLRESDIR